MIAIWSAFQIIFKFLYLLATYLLIDDDDDDDDDGDDDELFWGYGWPAKDA